MSRASPPVRADGTPPGPAALPGPGEVLPLAGAGPGNPEERAEESARPSGATTGAGFLRAWKAARSAQAAAQRRGRVRYPAKRITGVRKAAPREEAQ